MIRLISLCSLLHYLVDGICACCLYELVTRCGGADVVAMILTYNVLAFMTQPLTGWAIDSMRRRRTMLATSVALLTAAALTAFATTATTPPAQMLRPMMFATAILLGLGNSMFHVWGGKVTAVTTANDCRALGVFVSTGALGLTTGVLFHTWWMLAALVVALATAAHFGAASAEANEYRELPVRHSSDNPTVFWVALPLLMAFVMFRSYFGEAYSSGIEKDTALILAIAASAFAGKASGGWIARRIGLATAFVIAVLGVAACTAAMHYASAPLSSGITAAPSDAATIALLLLGIFLINTTMPITLYFANRLLPGREGLAFGLLAAVLVPGYLLATA